MLGKLGTSACVFPLDVFSITWQPTQSLPAISLPIVTSGIVDFGLVRLHAELRLLSG